MTPAGHTPANHAVAGYTPPRKLALAESTDRVFVWLSGYFIEDHKPPSQWLPPSWSSRLFGLRCKTLTVGLPCLRLNLRHLS